MKYLVFSIFVVLTLISCGESAMHYNDTLVKSQIDISENLNKIFSENVSYDQIVQQRKAMIENAEKGLEATQTLTDFNGNTSFKFAAVKYYSFVSSFFSTTDEIDSLLYFFSNKERMKKISQEKFDRFRWNLDQFQSIEDEFLNEQRKFAQENQLKL